MRRRLPGRGAFNFALPLSLKNAPGDQETAILDATNLSSPIHDSPIARRANQRRLFPSEDEFVTARRMICCRTCVVRRVFSQPTHYVSPTKDVELMTLINRWLTIEQFGFDTWTRREQIIPATLDDALIGGAHRLWTQVRFLQILQNFFDSPRLRVNIFVTKGGHHHGQET